MTTPGDPNEPRPGQDRRPEHQQESEWWSEGTLPDDRSDEEPERPGEEPRRPGEEPRRPGEEPRPGAEPREPADEPIAPAPPVVPPPDVPPTHEPRPSGQPSHPDLPTAPETPQPTGAGPSETSQPVQPVRRDVEETQVFPIPGATPTYPGWGREQEEGEPPGRQQPSRYEQGDQPHFAPPGESSRWEGGQAGTPPPGGGPAGTPPHGAGEYRGDQAHPGEEQERRDQAYRQDEDQTIPGTTPSSPYGGPPGYPPPPPPGTPYGPSGGQYGQYGPYQQPRPGSGLATASLVLGVASPFLVFVCFTGLITAILSIIFGCVALAKRVGKGRAIAGIVISALSLVLFAIVAIWFWNVVQECAQLPSPMADRCFESKFPWMSGTR
ncbi:DUF4190 domain-containing protein [Nonomuraea sp. NPDC049421]|uniref:DUF4190 domain-containing protein n=1 Tax=Nonomuraea sp. NPDC049421 TaxID=3155275 RepID=UPI003435745D